MAKISLHGGATSGVPFDEEPESESEESTGTEEGSGSDTDTSVIPDTSAVIADSGTTTTGRRRYGIST